MRIQKSVVPMPSQANIALDKEARAGIVVQDLAEFETMTSDVSGRYDYGRSRRMVQIAITLLVLAAVGSFAIGVGKLVKSISASANAVVVIDERARR